MRCIVYASKNGSKEGVYFTDDNEMDANEVIPPDCELSDDFDTDDGFPTTFPTDCNLERGN